jgi:anti-sigma regulatory factor (Ser/Thr protein kinase)
LRELALHILDLIENSIRADASVIAVTVAEKPADNRLEIVVEDNGAGLSVAPEQALDPFFTTKNGKRTGLGLSLFRAAAEQAGGTLNIERSALGGLAVRAKLRLKDIDRKPLGDLAATLSSVVCTNPHLDLWCTFVTDAGECVVRVSDVAKELCANERCGLAIARRVSERIKNGLAAIQCSA